MSLESKAISLLNRRQTLALLGAAGATAVLGPLKEETVKAADTCIPLATAQTEGPYWVEENLNRSDIRIDPSDNSVRPGTLLSLAIKVQEVTSASCSPLVGAHVDIWHCDAAGLYSDVSANNTVGKKFLRGYQTTGDDGTVQFTTIYPGWYSGRTVHIHIRIRTYNGTSVYDAFTAQLFFDDTLTDQVFTQTPYSTRGTRNTRNSNDMVLTGTNGTVVYVALTKTAAGYSGSAEVGVNLKQVAAAAPAIKTGGVANAASFEAGVVAGSWVSIFGTNLAASTHQLEGADLANGAIPTSLKGVSVAINNKPAYIGYVSPTQLNVQAPADTATGSVSVTVTNAAGTSAAATVTAVAMQPAFFPVGNYVFAVRPDGTLITGVSSSGAGTVAAAKPGETIELFGTGFGPTTPEIAPGALPAAAAPLANSVVVTIGGAQASVPFAGLQGAGVYQFNVTVPALPDGDHEVVAKIAGLQSKSGLLLKVSSQSAAASVPPGTLAQRRERVLSLLKIGWNA